MPTSATALVVETPTVAGAARLLVGIALVMTLGEIARRLVLRAEAADGSLVNSQRIRGPAP